MFAFSTLWRYGMAPPEQYWAPFWEKNIFNFEWMEDYAIESRLLQTIRVTDVAMCKPQRVEDRLPSLVSEDPEQSAQALLRLRHAIETVYLCKSPYLVIWPGRIPLPGLHDEQDISAKLKLRKELAPTYLERLCRLLFDIGKQHPEIVLCIPPAGSVEDIPLFDELEWILSDLHKVRIGYWHNSADAHRQQMIGLGEHEAWLAKYAKRTVGIHLEDMVDLQGLYPPGIGEVDFRMIKSYLPASAIRVLRVNSACELSDIWFACQYLQELGLIE